MKIEFTHTASKEDEGFLKGKLNSYNDQHRERDGLPVEVLARNSDGGIIGGLLGRTYLCWLHIEILWVDEDSRSNGIGEKLVAMAEGVAISRKCGGSTLDTFTYQAAEFYIKVGYSEFGRLPGYGDYDRVFLRKELSSKGISGE